MAAVGEWAHCLFDCAVRFVPVDQMLLAVQWFMSFDEMVPGCPPGNQAVEPETKFRSYPFIKRATALQTHSLAVQAMLQVAGILENLGFRGVVE